MNLEAPAFVLVAKCKKVSDKNIVVVVVAIAVSADGLRNEGFTLDFIREIAEKEKLLQRY